MSVNFHPDGNWDLCLNISNGYSHIPCEMMGTYSQEISPSDLVDILDKVTTCDVEPFVTATKCEDNVVYVGRTLEDVEDYRRRLITIIQFCLDQDVPLVWS